VRSGQQGTKTGKPLHKALPSVRLRRHGFSECLPALRGILMKAEPRGAGWRNIGTPLHEDPPGALRGRRGASSDQHCALDGIGKQDVGALPHQLGDKEVAAVSG